MILGNGRRERPVVQLMDEYAELGVLESPADLRPDPLDHRDRGGFLSPRLYPTGPYDPWAAVAEAEPA